MNKVKSTKFNTLIRNDYYRNNMNFSRTNINNLKVIMEDSKDTFVKTSSVNKHTANNIGIFALGLSAVAFTGYLIKVKGNIFSTGKSLDIIDKITKKVILGAKQIEIFEAQMVKHKGDISYRKNLLTQIGGKPQEYALLRPIIGPEEYKATIKSFHNSEVHFTPGESLITAKKDGYSLVGENNRTFRFNGHNHTIYSDGKLTVQELLDKSAEYADKVAEKIAKDKSIILPESPYTIGITDHDSIEACKEAVKIISKDPWKYRNLRVSLGTELSVENKSIPQKLKMPIEIHLLLKSINPFDKEINTMLKTMSENRVNFIKEFIDDFAKEAKKVFSKSADKLNYEDSKGLHPALKYAHTHTNLSTKDYVQFRTIFSECVEQNTALINELKEKGVDTKKLSYITPKEDYLDKVTDNFGKNYWNKYKKALDKYVAELLNIPEHEAAQKMHVTPEMDKLFNHSEWLSHNQEAKMNLQPAYLDMDKVVELMQNQEHGYMGLAHPGIINMGKFLENPAQSQEAMGSLIKTFKEKGKDKSLFIEAHYPYFGDFKNKHESRVWLNNIKEYAIKNELLQTGGIDTHGKNIFYADK